ncbi:UDP-GlcNAc:undecaprenyl-phosphate GlcNAc-1-phosphate transferase [Pedobacter sp. UYP24]
MIYLLYLAIVAMFLNSILISFIIKISKKFSLFDIVDRYRKDHEVYISRLGGVGMFITINVVVLLCSSNFNTSLYGILNASFILFMLGLKDDLLGGARPIEKFMMQSLAVGILIFSEEYRSIPLFSIVYIGQFSQPLDSILVFFLILFIINSFNLIDGVDGLAAVVGIVVNVFLSSLLFGFGIEDFALIGFVTSGALLGFLRFNLINRKIFMGDSGAMLVGLVSIVLSLKFIEINKVTSKNIFLSPIALVVTLMVVPVFDSTRILLIRYLHGKSLLKGDRNHIHHRLKDVGFRDSQVVFILITFTICTCCFVMCFQRLGNAFLIFIVILFCLIGNFLLSYFRGKFLSDQYSLLDVIFKDTFNLK